MIRNLVRDAMASASTSKGYMNFEVMVPDVVEFKAVLRTSCVYNKGKTAVDIQQFHVYDDTLRSTILHSLCTGIKEWAMLHPALRVGSIYMLKGGWFQEEDYAFWMRYGEPSHRIETYFITGCKIV